MVIFWGTVHISKKFEFNIHVFHRHQIMICKDIARSRILEILRNSEIILLICHLTGRIFYPDRRCPRARSCIQPCVILDRRKATVTYLIYKRQRCYYRHFCSYDQLWCSHNLTCKVSHVCTKNTN